MEINSFNGIILESEFKNIINVDSDKWIVYISVAYGNSIIYVYFDLQAKNKWIVHQALDGN